MGMGQDEKAAVVGDEVKALILQEWGPADKTVSRPALEGRRRPAKQGKPLSGALGHIAQRLPHPVREAQVVMPAHQLFPSLPLPRENRPNDDFLQEALMDPLKFHTRRLTHSQEQSSEKNEKTSITTTYLKHWRSPGVDPASEDDHGLLGRTLIACRKARSKGFNSVLGAPSSEGASRGGASMSFFRMRVTEARTKSTRYPFRSIC